MRGVNKVIIVGNLGNDPEYKQFDNGGSVTTISVATSEQWNDKQTGEKREATEWHRIVMFNKLGEIAAQYLRKGSKVYIEGKLQTRKWQDSNGQDRYTTEIVANQMQMLGEANNQPQNNGYQQPQNNQGQQNYQQPAQPQQNQQQPQNNQGFNNQMSGGQPSNVKDQDIPFNQHFGG